MCEMLQTLPPKTVILLHATCHNPTGRDPSLQQWREIYRVIQKRELIPFFDCAYQGFGQGIDEDAQAIRIALEYCPEILVAYSCSKNFSLYNERVGALYIVTGSPSTKMRVGSQVKRLIRVIYSNPPSSGARIVAKVLADPKIYAQWQSEVDAMRHRINSMREELIDRLISRSKTVDFLYLRGHLGLFMFIAMTKAQVDCLIRDHAVYVLDNGRISVAGLNQKNIDRVVDSILKVLNA